VTTDVLAQGGSIEPPGKHIAQFEFLGMMFNGDTMWTSAIAALIVLGGAFFVRSRITSGVPGGVQLAYEGVTNYLSDQVESRLGRRPAAFAIPLTVTLFSFILVANWLQIFPSGHPELLKPPTADANLPYAMALFTMGCVWFFGIRENGLRYFKHFVQPSVVMLPINAIEEIVKPVTLSLRLFGNILSGTIMISLITLFPAWLLWVPNTAWKLFDLFIGAIQAFIFSLLTVIYFSQAAGEEQG